MVGVAHLGRGKECQRWNCGEETMAKIPVYFVHMITFLTGGLFYLFIYL
jgi:hypothetical protein